jgi:hypothetical protein
VKKLILKLDVLKVESFEVSDAARAAGTVRAHGTWYGGTCVTQCATGPCDCYFTDPSCNSPCD